MKDEKKRRMQVLIALAVGFIVISAAIIGIIYWVKSISPQQNDQNKFYDPGSGETILSPEGKTPETYGVDPDAPIYIGFHKLIDFGLSFDQVTSIKQAFNDYAKQVKDKNKINEVSLTADSIKYTPNREGPDVYTFKIVINRQTDYRVVVTAPDILTVQVALYTKDGGEAIFKAQKTSSLPQDASPEHTEDSDDI